MALKLPGALYLDRDLINIGKFKITTPLKKGITMQKIIIAALTMSASLAMANDALKIKTVQSLYRSASQGVDSAVVLERNADASLKQAYRHADKVERQGGMCIEEDPMFGNQDPQTKAKVTVTVLQNGLTQAKFKQYGQNQTINYKLSCTGNACKVNDVLNGGSSFRQELSACRP
ncbi:hypothetical protein [Paralysiella testudinis]|uniref:Uncharacterized protein n=1 Tax=Paralysiella testudinis TaxID=2809020 RepID=A0A892ZCT3_9NEIS|nr:hypothetical protein [Paralysiella testudinis]QRQ80841.1 hypothetical protein JQU52_08760 [Paralysiella testudinis]